MTHLAKPLFGFDYTSRIDPATLKAYGVEAVVRYLSRYSWKALTREEARELEAAGIGIALVFEDGAQNALNGPDAGRSDAEYGLKQAIDIFGSDRGGNITFAVDYDPAGSAAATDGYFDGTAEVLQRHRAGPYGGKEVVTRQANRGFGALFQTYAWSGNELDTRAQIYQFSNDHPVGPGVDFDHFYYADYGQWTHRAAAPAEDRYAIFPRDIPGLGNERLLVEQVDGALHHPLKYRVYLKVTLYRRLKQHRDRIWRVAHYEPPNFVILRGLPTWGVPKPNWGDHRGRRWQELNNRMTSIRAL